MASPWWCPIPTSLVPHALSLAFEGNVPLSRRSGNVPRVFIACRLHYLAAAVPTACMHGRYGLCLGPLVTGMVCSPRLPKPQTHGGNGEVAAARQHQPEAKLHLVTLDSPQRAPCLPTAVVTPNLQALGVFNIAWFPPCRSKTETHAQLQCLSPTQPS